MSTIQVVFDGPPAHESGRFIEVEDEKGASINVGEWKDRGDGTWALVVDVDAGTKRKEAAAWDEGFEAGWEESRGICVSDISDAETVNPYRREAPAPELIPGTLNGLNALSIRTPKDLP